MGKLAGYNMTGSHIRHSGFLSLMNTVEILDVPVTAIGMIDPVDRDTMCSSRRRTEHTGSWCLKMRF